MAKRRWVRQICRGFRENRRKGWNIISLIRIFQVSIQQKFLCTCRISIKGFINAKKNMPEVDFARYRLDKKCKRLRGRFWFLGRYFFWFQPFTVNEREIFIYAWEKGKREFEKDGGIKKGNKVHPTLIRIAFKLVLSTLKTLLYCTTCTSTRRVAPVLVTCRMIKPLHAIRSAFERLFVLKAKKAKIISKKYFPNKH